jgi:hypothetical protein
MPPGKEILPAVAAVQPRASLLAIKTDRVSDYTRISMVFPRSVEIRKGRCSVLLSKKASEKKSISKGDTPMKKKSTKVVERSRVV